MHCQSAKVCDLQTELQLSPSAKVCDLQTELQLKSCNNFMRESVQKQSSNELWCDHRPSFPLSLRLRGYYYNHIYRGLKCWGIWQK